MFGRRLADFFAYRPNFTPGNVAADQPVAPKSPACGNLKSFPSSDLQTSGQKRLLSGAFFVMLETRDGWKSGRNFYLFVLYFPAFRASPIGIYSLVTA
jgi:hypothetical protein